VIPTRRDQKGIGYAHRAITTTVFKVLGQNLVEAFAFGAGLKMRVKPGH
jgi:hypothetical protein